MSDNHVISWNTITKRGSHCLEMIVFFDLAFTCFISIVVSVFESEILYSSKKCI